MSEFQVKEERHSAGGVTEGEGDGHKKRAGGSWIITLLGYVLLINTFLDKISANLLILILCGLGANMSFH